jgi:hypothetical protein
MQAARKFLWTLTLAGLVILGGRGFVSAAPAPGEADPTPETAKWVVEGAEVVVHLNLRQVFASPAMKKGGVEAIKALIEKDETAKKVFEATGIDPLKDIDSITLSGTAAAPKEVKALAVVRGKFNLDKIHKAAEKFAEDKPAELKLSKSDGVQLYEVKVKENAGVGAFLDGTTLILSPTKEATLDAIKTIGRRSAKISRDLDSALAKFSGKESMSLALVITDEMKKQIGKAPGAAEIAPNLKMVTGALELSDAATLGLVVKTDDEEAANKLQGLVKQGMMLVELMATSDDKVGPLLSEILKATKLGQEKTNVSLTLKVTQEMIEKASKKGT